MNRRELYALLPTPESIGASEYTALHNFLVDAVNEWTDDDNEDIVLFATTILEELREWTQTIINRIVREAQNETD